MKSVKIIGIGAEKCGRSDDNLIDLMSKSSIKAITDAGNVPIDAIIVGNMAAEDFTKTKSIPTYLTDEIGYKGTPSIRVENGPASGSAAVMTAFFSVCSGVYDTVLVTGGEKMTSVSTDECTDILAEMLHPVEKMHGFTLPTWGAILTRLYMNEGLTREQLSLVSIKNHKNGAKNPIAHFQKIITDGDIKNSSTIIDPLKLYDICPISDGSASVVISSKTMEDSIEIAGIGQATDTHAVFQREDLTDLKALQMATKKAIDMADISIWDIDLMELHDAFTILEICEIENLGLFKREDIPKAYEDGIFEIDGENPINTSGGLKARGHPVGGTGVYQIYEIVEQLRGEAGDRQVDDAKSGLCVNFGGFADNVIVSILKRS